MKRRQLVLAALCTPSAGVLGAASSDGALRLSRPVYRIDPRGWYPYELLSAAVSALGDGTQVRAVDRMSGPRAMRELGSPNGEVDVVVAMPSAERDRLLRVVPVPLYRGLFGWRLLVIRRGEGDRWASVRTVQDLSTRSLLQGTDWGDTEILRANGMRVLTGPRVETLYADLANGRGDAFPRGATEPRGEMVRYGDAFEVAPDLALHYPADLFFYVRRENEALAKRLQRALSLLHARGEHDRLLLALHGEDIAQARLAQRRVLKLSNPAMPAALTTLASSAWRVPTP